MLRVQRNQLGSSSLPPAHADGAEQRTPAGALCYSVPPDSAELAACVRITEIANDGSRDINPVGELMFRALPFLFGASPSGRQIRRQNIGSCPQAESSAKSVGIFARTTPWRGSSLKCRPRR